MNALDDDDGAFVNPVHISVCSEELIRTLNAEPARRTALVYSSDMPARWGALRALYGLWLPQIEMAHPRYHDPGFVDFGEIFTPIERHVWESIRYYALPLYPQIPAGRFFIDFADPVFRIGVECDGKGWHDKGRDAARDAELIRDGWTIYRIQGSECVRPAGNMYQWATRTSDGVIAAIAYAHYGKHFDEELSEADLRESLLMHRSRRFI